MNARRPNILLLTIDALRTDRSSVLGYRRPTTPTLERLAESGILCSQTVSNAAFSQPSLTSMFTSTLPLSFGGYDKGAIGRPDSIFHHMEKTGYKVFQLSTYPTISRFFDFSGRGAESSILFALNTLPSLALAMIRESIRSYEAGDLSEAAMLEKVSPILDNFFVNIGSYCRERLDQLDSDRADFPTSRMVNDGYDFNRILGLIERHRAEFENENRAYIRKYLIPFPGTNGWLPREWKYMRTPRAFLSEGIFRTVNKGVSFMNPQLAKLREYRFKRYLDADSLVKRVISTLERAKKEPQPFFLWTHFFDTHTPYCPGQGADWYRSARTYLEKLGYPSYLDPGVGLRGKPKTEQDWETWSALYDAAVLYVDEKLSILLNYLEDSGLKDSTLIVISGDHGEELGEHGNIGHHFLPYQHNTRVPMVFYGPGVERSEVNHLTSLLDLCPTTAQLAGMDPAPGWQGRSVTSPEINRREFQITECFHGGNCLFESRPLYIGVRNKTHNYFWKEYRDPGDKYSQPGNELYDLRNDPAESENLFRPGHPVVEGFNKVIAKRLAELPEISDERLVSAFGDELAKAVRLENRKIA